MELKVWRDRRPDPTPEGLEQLDSYLDRFDLATGTLVVFDHRKGAPPLPGRIAFTTETSPAGRALTLLRL